MSGGGALARLRPRTLHGRLILLLVVLLGAVGALGVLGLARGSQLFFEEVHARLDAEVAEHIAETIHPKPDGTFETAELKGLFMDVMVINPALEVYLLDREGEVLAYDAPDELILRRSVDLTPVRRFLAAPDERVVHGDDPRSEDGTKPISVAPVRAEDGEHVGYLYVILGGQGYESVLASLQQSWFVRTAAAVALALLLVTAVVGAFAVVRLTRPLRRLSGRIHAFRSSEDDLEVDPAPPGGEVERLEAAFEGMAARIRAQVEELERNDERRREFVAGISHDLRTPASALQGYLETLLVRDEDAAPEERAQYVELALRQGRRLNRLVDQLFELARIEARQDVHPEPFSLAELVQDTVREFEERAAARGVSLRAVFPYDLPEVHADIGLIQRALDNLIDNALRYADEGAEVVVRLDAARGGVRVRVWNSGSAIPAGELPHLFERFHRGRREAAADGDGAAARGTGLGLAITRRIIDVHEGEISVRSEAREGTTFAFVLPRATED